MAKSPDRIGQIISQRYEVRDIIGRGGQGMVYRAFDRWTEREVAIKVLSSKASREPQMVERLMREQQALSALKGTSAVELYDVCRGIDGEVCLVMELLKGQDLEEYLYGIEQRKGRMGLTRIVQVFDPIVSTLETAHAAGILHRDLKPANIFLLEGGAVRLLDFGMARLKSAAPLTAAGTIMGSPSFMAPEAWRGISDLVDHRADVYSLGVILFRVLSGELPFGGDTLKDKFLNTTKAERPSLLELRPDLPPDVDEWVELALALDRDQRFDSVTALWNAFLRVFDLESPRHQSESLWAAAKGAVRRLTGSEPAPAPPAAELRPASNEPSFTREALARSAFHLSTPIDAQAEHLAESRPPRATGEKRLPVPPRAPSARPEPTAELDDSDLESVEKTLSMSDVEMVSDDTLPDSPSPEEK